MAKDIECKLADVFETVGLEGDAKKSRTSASDRYPEERLIEAQNRFEFQPGFFPGGAGKDPIITGPRATQMHKKHDAIPPSLQNWQEVIKRGKPVEELASIDSTSYLMDPSLGGERRMNLPSDSWLSRLEMPREKGEPYPEDPSQWSMDVVDPSGTLQMNWNNPEDVDALTSEYLNKADAFESKMTDASNVFNRRMKNWVSPEPGKPNVAGMLAQNFWTNFDKVIYGGNDDLLTLSDGTGVSMGQVEGDGGRNLIAAIDNRINGIQQIQAGVDSRSAAAGDVVQERVLQMHLDALASLSPELWRSNSHEYVRMLSLVYKGDADLMLINPLSIDYPSDLTKMLDAYAETARKGTIVPSNMREWIEKNSYAAREQGVDPNDMLRQKWPMIDVSPEALHKAAWMKKHVRDVSHYSGFMSPKTDFEKAMPLAQFHEIRDYDDELNNLLALRDRLVAMVDMKNNSGLEGASFASVMNQAPQIVQDMDQSLNATLTTLGRLYGGDRFVTKDSRLNPAYDVGEATKMEIFGKGLFLAQAWKAFLSKAVPALFEQQGIMPEEIGLLTDPDVLEASVVRGMARLASAADAFGDSKIADIIDAAI